MPVTPQLRRATLFDFDSLYTIWMQDHVLPFMTFESMNKEAFQPIFTTLFNSSEIYVLVVENHIVATMRIIPRKEAHQHSVELASFAVHQDHRRKGYGTLITKLLIAKIAREKPQITRIEAIQETDNPVGLACFSKIGFITEYTLPEWLRRKTGILPFSEKWHVGASFRVIFTLPEITLKTITQVKAFTPQLPALKIKNPKPIEIKFDASNHRYECYAENMRLVSVNIESGNLRIDHILFWDIVLHSDIKTHGHLIEQALRQFAVQLSKTYKKIETAIYDENTLTIVKNLGFYYRGIRIAGRRADHTYYNEICTDLSFFGIKDTLLMLKGEKEPSKDHKQHLIVTLQQCQDQIQQALQSKIIDDYAVLYVENICFQIVREQVTETRLYTELNKPWPQLIQSLPDNIVQCIMRL